MSPYQPLYPVGKWSGEVEPPPPENPYRSHLPFDDPFDHESFWNMPIGSGLTYLSTGSSRHTSTFNGSGGSGVSVNSNNWTDPVYMSSPTDPICEVRHYANLPNGWNNVANNQQGTPTTSQRLHRIYKGIRIPNEATWQSTTNTDRKVVVVQGQATTLTTENYDANNQLVSSYQETFAAGELAIEMHKFYRTTTTGLIYTTNLSRNSLVGYGMGYGAIASGVSMTGGFIRKWEFEAAAAGDHTAIKHALKIGLPNGKLQVGQIWPASHQDGNASTDYTGQNPMGTMIVLNTATNINSLGLSNIGRAVAWTLQNFGAYVLIRAGSGPLVFGVEAKPPFVNNATATQLRNDLGNLVYPHLRIATNSHQVGTLNAARQPLNPSLIAGGGTRRTIGQGIADFDNVTGLKLPIDPDGPWI